MIPTNPREQLIKLGAEKLADTLLDLSTRNDKLLSSLNNCYLLPEKISGILKPE